MATSIVTIFFLPPPLLCFDRQEVSIEFSALTEMTFHFLTEPKEVERFLTQLSEFATTIQISLDPLRSIMKSLLLVLNGVLKKGLIAEQVQVDSILLHLREEKATHFSEKWKQNASTLARWAIGQTLMINQLIDIDWKFGVTSGSSELEKVGSIILQLQLVVKKGNQTENMYTELSLPQFCSFLHGMECVSTGMDPSPPAASPSLGVCSQRCLPQSVGTPFGPAHILGAQVQKVYEKQQD
ncbi:PREDICTED: COMM domain-containing protein 7-like [Galeopterus variegatus]|uniref:COMM domain-containing protein 7-like n=1 Tax=Galeopterus variegatus TaxID=482537 RepID=A0ABM0RFV0_GALVR|nr:PREDICTED: COMM domain-containing protein 7-like [Galeopterus variegatus]